MRQVKVNGKTAQIPESWEDVTLERYTKAAKVMKANAGHAQKAMGAAIAALLGISEPALFSCDVDTVEEIAQILDFYFTTLPEPKPVSDFTIQGTKFIVPMEIEKQSFGEFADMDTLVTDHKEELLDAVPGILAIYCRPDKARYEPDLNPMRANLMESINIETAEGLAAFFLTRGQLSKATIAQFGSRLVSLIYKVHRLEYSPKHTVGWRRLLHLPTMIFYVWIRSRIKSVGQS